MVRGREAKLVKLAAASAPYAFLDLPWEEALQAFTERVPQRKNELQRLLKAYAQRSDEARRLALLQIQDFVKSSLTRHIAEGGTYGDFADDLEAGKESLGITVDDPAYLKMVFRTNVQSAYGAGRFRAITDPDVIELRPFVQYRTVGDARVRPEHAVLDRGIYLAASPEWHRIAPPNDFACRCSMCSLSREEVGSEKILGQVPANYVASPEFDTAPMPHLEPANDNAREMSVSTRQKPTQLELSYNPSQVRAEDGKWSSGSAAGRAGALTPHKEAYNSAKAAHESSPSEKSHADLEKATADLRRARRVVGEHNRRGEDIADDAHAHGKVLKAQASLADANERFAAARKSGDKVAAAEAGGDIDWAKHEHAQARSDLLNHYVETGRADKALEVAHKPVVDLTDSQIGSELKRIHSGADGDTDAAVKKNVVRDYMDELGGSAGYDENQVPISERAHFGVLDQYKDDLKSIGVRRAKLEKTPATAARKEAKAKYDEAARRMKARAERLVDELGLKAHVADDDATEMSIKALAYNPGQKRASDGEWTAGGGGAAQKARPSRDAREKSTAEALQKLRRRVSIAGESGRSPIAIGIDPKVASQMSKKTRALSPPPPKVAAVVGGTAVAKKVSDWSSRWVSNTTRERAEDAARALTQPGSWAQHQYAATQSILKEHMADLRKQGVLDADGYLTLYRGASGQQAKDIQKQVDFKALHPNIKERPSIAVHPVTSWSASPLVAKGFAGDDGVVIKQKIHASRVFASHLGQSGRWNSWDEQEFAIVHPERTLPLDKLLTKDAI